MVEKFEYYDREQRAMISWLSTRSPDVWHVVAGHLNFDYADDVFEWILTQPNCDLATAALYFWRSEPADKLYSLVEEPDYGADERDFLAIQDLVKRVNSGFYHRSEIRFAGPDCDAEEDVPDWMMASAEELRTIARDAGDVELPWVLPEALVPPFGYRPVDVSDDENPSTSEELQGLFAALGTHFGTLPDAVHIETKQTKAQPSGLFGWIGALLGRKS